jgi:hypothetical protein
MGINRFIPQNIRNCISPEDLRSLDLLSDDEARDKWFKGREKEMHQQFEGWLRRNGIKYSHPRMDKRSTVQQGQFDFMIWRRGRLCWVEFKTESGRLSKDQKLFLEDQVLDETPALVAHSYEYAVQFVEKLFSLAGQ